MCFGLLVNIVVPVNYLGKKILHHIQVDLSAVADPRPQHKTLLFDYLRFLLLGEIIKEPFDEHIPIYGNQDARYPPKKREFSQKRL